MSIIKPYRQNHIDIRIIAACIPDKAAACRRTQFDFNSALITGGESVKQKTAVKAYQKLPSLDICGDSIANLSFSGNAVYINLPPIVNLTGTLFSDLAEISSFIKRIALSRLFVISLFSTSAIILFLADKIASYFKNSPSSKRV